MSKDIELEKLLQELAPPKKEEVTKRQDERFLLKFTKDDFRRGMILSEILGPPKGRHK
ncbi:MAG: hypothetical protein JXQ23_12200 [Clostridia bacterium]|nr:hypothetical protein [Clostridia bacterium]